MTRRVPFALALVALIAGLTAGAVSAATYQIDAAHSNVLFKVKHMGISTVTGRFESFTGAFDYDAADISTARVNAVIEAASINTNQENRDNHLRSADFFDVENHPQILFAGTKIERDAQSGDLRLHGDLTMRGVTRPIVLDLEPGGGVVDMQGNERVAFSATGEVNRKDFGLNWSKVLETGGLVVSDEVQIVLEIEGVRQKVTG